MRIWPWAGSLSILVLSLGISQPVEARQAGSPDEVRMNRTIELLEGDENTFGLFSHDRSPDNARALARSGLDFIFIDMEHGPFDMEGLRMFLLAMTDKLRIMEKGNLQPDVTPIVRVPPNGRDDNSWVVKQVLDAGAMGIMFPYIDTAEQAELSIRSMRYPQPRGSEIAEPVGIRGSGAHNANWYWGVPDYIERADVWPLAPRGDLMAVIQIETVEGVRNVESILDVPGVSAIFVGPADLALSLGVPNGHPEHEAAIQTVLAAAKVRNMPIGITTGAQTVEERLRQGFNFVTVSYGDGGLPAAGAEALRLGRAFGGGQ